MAHSPQSYQHSGSRCISERRHEIQKVVQSHDRHPKTFCEGNHVRVFSRSSGKWVHGRITKIEDDSLVRVEYEFKDDTYGKNMHVDSDHLIIPCQLVDSDLTSNKYQCDLRVPTSEVVQQPEQWGKSCPKASGLNSRGCLMPSESEYSEKDPEIGFFDNFKNPFRSGPPSSPWKVKGDRGRLSKVDGNREWIVTSLRPTDVKKREKAANDTLRACSDQGYIFHGRPDSGVRLVSEYMVSATCVIKDGLHSAVPCSLDSRQCRIYWETGDPIDVAEDASTLKDGVRSNLVALVTAVSKYCGGFLTGGIPKLEESLCMRTSLFQSLQREFDDKGQIPAEGAVLSPGVRIFRGSYAEGYPFLDETVYLQAVVSVAMPNRNPNLSEPVHRFSNEQEYHKCLDKKMSCMLRAATEEGCDVVVVPDIGYGSHANDRYQVGCALGRTIADSLLTATRITRVTLVGDRDGDQDFADGVLDGGLFDRLNTPGTVKKGEPVLLAIVTE